MNTNTELDLTFTMDSSENTRNNSLKHDSLPNAANSSISCSSDRLPEEEFTSHDRSYNNIDKSTCSDDYPNDQPIVLTTTHRYLSQDESNLHTFQHSHGNLKSCTNTYCEDLRIAGVGGNDNESSHVHKDKALSTHTSQTGLTDIMDLSINSVSFSHGKDSERINASQCLAGYEDGHFQEDSTSTHTSQTGLTDIMDLTINSVSFSHGKDSESVNASQCLAGYEDDHFQKDSTTSTHTSQTGLTDIMNMSISSVSFSHGKDSESVKASHYLSSNPDKHFQKDTASSNDVLQTGLTDIMDLSISSVSFSQGKHSESINESHYLSCNRDKRVQKDKPSFNDASQTGLTDNMDVSISSISHGKHPESINTSHSLRCNLDKQVKKDTSSSNQRSQNGSTGIMDLAISSVPFSHGKTSEIVHTYYCRNENPVAPTAISTQPPPQICQSEFTDAMMQRHRNKVHTRPHGNQKAASMIDFNRPNEHAHFQSILEMKHQDPYQKQLQQRLQQAKHCQQQISQHGQLSKKSDNPQADKSVILQDSSIAEVADNENGIVKIDEYTHKHNIASSPSSESVEYLQLNSNIISPKQSSIRESIIADSPEIPPKVDSRVNYLEAKLRILSTKLNNYECQVKTVKSTNEALTAEIHEKNMQQIEDCKKVKDMEFMLEKHDILCKVATSRVEELEEELNTVKDKLTGVLSKAAIDATARKFAETRLIGVLEKLDIERAALSSSKKRYDNDRRSADNRYQELRKEADNFKLQRDELRIGFMKQMQLVNLYKMQKNQFEGAWQLARSEREYMGMAERARRLIRRREGGDADEGGDHGSVNTSTDV